MKMHKIATVFLNGSVRLLVGSIAFYFGDLSISCDRASAAEALVDSPLQKPFLAASPQELIGVATKSETDLSGASIEMLLDEGHFRIDSQGRVTEIYRQIYHCLKQEAFDQHGVVQAEWRSWHHDRPKIEARVITPNGEVHTLNQNTIEAIRIPSGQENVFTDVKLLRAPLPALTVDCIVETRVIVREHAPFSEAGSSSAFQLGDLLAPTRFVRVVIEAPTSIPLHYRVMRSDQTAVVKQEDGSQVVNLSLGPVPPLVEQLEAHLPSDQAPVPMILFSTVASWQAVAGEYAASVRRQLAEQDLNDVVQTVLGENRGLQEAETVALLLAYLQSSTRYTSVSFGHAAIVPSKPQETLKRRYGDCKDLSTLLVALLQAVGIEADVALVQVGSGMDPIADIPHLGAFDHAIVYVPGSTPLWIDPTDRFTQSEEVSTSIQGRLALIANESTTDLVRIPRSKSAANRMTRRHVITLSQSSPATVATKTTCDGAFETPLRTFFASTDRNTQRESLRQQGQISLGTGDLVDFKYTPPNALKEPFQLDTEFTEPRIAIVRHPEAAVNLALHEVFDMLPFDLVGPPDTSMAASSDEAPAPSKQRVGQLSLPFPFRHELAYHVILPPGYLPSAMPDDFSIRSGPATFQVTYRTDDDHSIRIGAAFDSGHGNFTAKEVNELRRQIESLAKEQGYQSWQVPIRFEHKAGKHFEAGRWKEAIEALHQLHQENPDDPTIQVQLAQAVLQLGLGDLARKHARQAVEIAPKDPDAHYVLGYVLSHNRIGQYQTSGYDRSGALSAYLKALELSPDDADARWDYGMLLECDEQGVRYADPTAVGAAIAEFTKVYDEHKEDHLLNKLATSLCMIGNYQQSESLLEKANSSATRDVLLLAAIAVDEGAEACANRLITLWQTKEQRQTSLPHLMTVLNLLREYKVAANLARHLAENSTQQQQLLLQNAKAFDLLSRFVPEEPLEATPVRLVKSLLANALIHGSASSQLERFFVEIPQQDDFTFAEELPPWLDLLRDYSLRSNQTHQRTADIVTELGFQVTDQGTNCFRVEFQHKNNPELTGTVFVVRDADANALQVCCTGSRHTRIGQRVLDLINEGHHEDARRWLQWVYELQRKDLGWFDQFQGSPFARLWLAAGSDIDDKDLEIAAAALAVDSDSAAKSVAILSARRGDLEEIKQIQVDRALTYAHTKLENFQDLTKLTKRMSQQHPRAIEPAVLQLRALFRTQDTAALRHFVDKHVGMNEHHAWGQLLLAATMTSNGNTEQAAELLAELRQRQDRLSGYMLDYLVWLSFFQDPLPEGVVALTAEYFKSITSAPLEVDIDTKRRAYVHYALALSEAGQFSTAIEVLHAMPAVDPEKRPDRIDNYVLGRIAEACGFEEHAVSLFTQVTPPEPHRLNTIYDLAQRRLEYLSNRSRAEAQKKRTEEKGTGTERPAASRSGPEKALKALGLRDDSE